MKLSYISAVILLVSLLVVPTVQAQTPAADNQSAVSSAASPAQTASAAAEVPRLIKFSGTLLDSQGRPVAGPVGVTFALYAEQTGGASLWLETQNVRPDENGNYTVLLGAESAHGVPMELFSSAEAHWLGIQVGQQPEKERFLLVSVPYALKAGDAQTLGGLPPSAFAPATSSTSSSVPSPSGTPTTSLTPARTPATAAAPLATACTGITADGTATANLVAKFTGPCTVHQSILFDNGTNVGIGNTAPAAKLDVKGNEIVRGSLQLPATGTATSTTSFTSNPLDAFASAFNSTALKAQNQLFRWQVEPVGNNTTAPSGKLSLLFGANGATPAETGFSISNKGIINFAAGQTLPVVTGNETVSGNVSANELISTVATGTPPLKVTSKTQVANLNASFLGGLPAGAFASSGSNVFRSQEAIQASTPPGMGALEVAQQGSGGAGIIAEASGGQAIQAISRGSGPALDGESESGGPALMLTIGSGDGDLISARNTVSPGTFRVFNTGTGEFTGAGNGSGGFPLSLTIGNVGCGPGDSLNGSAGIQVGGSLGCTTYNLLGDGANTFINSATGGAIKFRQNNLDQMIIVSSCPNSFSLSSPCVGIFTTAPDENLSVNGNANKIGGGSWDTFSDGRLKNVFGGFHAGLKQVLQLNPIRYQYKEENPLGIHDSAEHIGLVAQEVEKVIPEAVSANNKGYLLVNNDPILWTMLNAIKEQQRQIQRLARENRELRKTNQTVEARLARLENSRQSSTPGR